MSDYKVIQGEIERRDRLKEVREAMDGMFIDGTVTPEFAVSDAQLVCGWIMAKRYERMTDEQRKQAEETETDRQKH